METLTESETREACQLNAQMSWRAVTPTQAVPLDQLLAEVQATADLPLELAMTWPAAAYTSESFFEWEQETLLRSGWQCVAHASQIAEPGSFLTLELLGEALIVTRDKDSQIQVLSRACPHRGMDIMPPGFKSTRTGEASTLVCPYHSWTFGMDGGLRGCAEMHKAKDFCRETVGLKKFRTSVWHEFVFVNLDGAAPLMPAEQWAEFAPALEKLAAQDLVVVDAREWFCPFNWKVLVENFMESYHHLGAHAQTLQPIMPAKNTWTESEHAHYIRCHLPYGPKAPQGGNFPTIAGLDDRESNEWGLTLGFPSWLLAYVPDCLIWYRVQPEGPHRHTLLTTLLVPRAVMALPDYQERLTAATEASVSFHLEDMAMCAGIQRSYYGHGYQQGRLSHLEMPILLLQRYFAARSRGVWPTQDREPLPSQQP